MIDDASTRVLLAVLALPAPRTVTDVAESAGMPRTTTYGHLRRLKYLGLVAWDEHRAGTLRPAVQIVGEREPGPAGNRDHGVSPRTPVEAPPPHLVAGGHGQRLSLPEGAEPVQGPVTIVDRDLFGWRWMCSWCAATEAGFAESHHARTVGDEHRLSHRHPELHPHLDRHPPRPDRPGRLTPTEAYALLCDIETEWEAR